MAGKIPYPLGISTDPKQVIIGRDGWLYLGDEYEQRCRLIVASDIG